MKGLRYWKWLSYAPNKNKFLIRNQPFEACFKNYFIFGIVQEVKNFKEFYPTSKIHEIVDRSHICRVSLLFSLVLMVVTAKMFLRLSQHTSQTSSFVLKCIVKHCYSLCNYGKTIYVNYYFLMEKLFENKLKYWVRWSSISAYIKHCLSFNSRLLSPEMMNGHGLAEHSQKLMQTELMQRRKQLPEYLLSSWKGDIVALAGLGKSLSRT